MAHLVPTVVDEDLQHGRLLPARVQRGQIVEGGVHGSVGPVLELPGQMAHFLVFDLSSDDVLEHLGEQAATSDTACTGTEW